MPTFDPACVHGAGEDCPDCPDCPECPECPDACVAEFPVAGLSPAVWYDAAETAAVWAVAVDEGTANVSVWPDKSGNKMHAIRSTNVPVLIAAGSGRMNDLPHVHFTSDTLRSLFLHEADMLETIMWAFDIDTGQNGTIIGGTNTGLEIDLNGSDIRVLKQDVAVMGQRAEPADEVPSIFGLAFDGVAGTVKLWLDGAVEVDDHAQTLQAFDFYLGGRANGALAHPQLRFGEVIVFDGVLTTTQLDAVGAYLTDKWVP
jgi:hypothetical protein